MDNDSNLVYRARNGDRTALEQIITLYDKKVYNFIYKIVRNEETSKDITQDTFIKMFQYIDQFDSRKSFATWLFTIAKNTAFNYLKRYKKLEFVELKSDEHCERYDPAAAYEERQEMLKLIESIDKLPEKYKELIHMKYVLGLKYEEISHRLHLPVHKVESRLYMARQRLLKQLDKDRHTQFNNARQNFSN